MNEFTITSHNPEGLVQQLRAIQQTGCGALTKECWAIASQIEAQLPKAPVEEPTEPPEPTQYGSIILARAGEHEQRVQWCSPTSEPGWYSEFGAFVGGYQMLRDVEVLRVGIGERLSYVCEKHEIEDCTRCSPSPAEAVEADKARQVLAVLVELHDGPRDDHYRSRKPLAWQAARDALAEPSPVQVEAEPGCKRCGEQDCNDCWPSGLVAGTGYLKSVLAAPAEDDPIEALVQAFWKRWSSTEGDVRAFAARVLEVGGQQPGVPAFDREAVEDAIREALEDLAVVSITASDGPLPPENVIGHIAGFVRVALLPAKPSTADKEPKA